MTTISVEISHLRPDPANARQIDPDDVTDLVASIQAVGLLQPIVVRRDTAPADATPYYTIVAGARRVEACRRLGRTHIEAALYEQNGVLVASAAENMVRRPMHPVDQWRAVAALTADGYSLEGAAEALGIEQRTARRLQWLGGMAPEIIEALAGEPELPETDVLRTIALAPHAIQTKAFDSGRRKRGIDWDVVARGCNRQRIPRASAIFDHALMAWDEDLFAEPGSDEQFSTTDVKAFLAHQNAAIKERIAKGKGRYLRAGWDKWGAVQIPDGWKRSWEKMPKRWRDDDPRRVLLALREDGYHVGRVEELLIEPLPKREPRAQASAAAEQPVDSRPREPITKATRARLAAIKGEALREGLQAIPAETDLLSALRVLLLAFCADNVRIEGSVRSLREIADRLLTPEGKAKAIEPREMCALAIEVVGKIIAFDHPMTSFGTSGDAAEWIAEHVIAAARMPRCDTEEILKGFSHDALIELARKHGIDDGGKAKDVRARLIGRMEHWSPVTFGAPVALEFTVEDPEEASDED